MRRTDRLTAGFCGLLSCALLLVGGEAQAVAPPLPETVRVGVESTLGPDFFVESFAPVMRTLRARFPESRFVTTEYSPDALSKAVAEGEVDLFFADSALFGLLSHQEGARQIATRVVPGAENPGRAVGFTVVVPSESPLHALEDLEGKRLAVESRESFSPWLLFLGRMAETGLSTDDIAQRSFDTGYGVADPVRAVAAGHVDAAVLPACQLEQLLRSGSLRPGRLRVLEAQGSDQDPDEPLCVEACWRSGELFPDVVLGVSRGVSSEAATALTLTVLSALPTRQGYAWRVGSDWSLVEDLYRKLRIGPYGYLREAGWSVFWEQYRGYVLLGAALLAALLFHVFRVNLLVDRRTRELSEAIREKERLDEEARRARERLSDMERASVVSELSSMFAHEVRQPLAAVTAYADGIGIGLRSGADTAMLCEAAENLAQETKRISDIVERVRGYAKARLHPRERLDMREIVERALRTFSHGSVSAAVKVAYQRNSRTVSVEVEPLELELAVVNLLRNAAQAMTAAGVPERNHIALHLTVFSPELLRSRFSIEAAESFAAVIVEDEGLKLSEEAFSRLAEPVQSLKKEGLGLGLTIVKHILEAHGGFLIFELREDAQGGLRAVLLLPVAEAA